MSVKKGLLFVVSLLCLLTVTISASAMPVTYNVNGSHEISNNHSLKTLSITFLLTAKSENAPMPAGSTDGVKKVTITAGEKFNFGDIVFDKPGDYEYTVSREKLKIKNLEEDLSVYTVHVTVYSNGEMAVVCSKEGSSSKPDEIRYSDKYTEKGTTTNTKTTSKRSFFQTGDIFTNICMGILIFLILLINILVISKKNRK